jgi:dynein intermediate chain 4, axonemal
MENDVFKFQSGRVSKPEKLKSPI